MAAGILRRVAREDRARKIARKILDDVTDRRGWRQEWDGFDDDVKKEIIQTWTRIIASAL